MISAAISGNIPISIRFAISDHPWVDSTTSAAVRVAMTVADKGSSEGVLAIVKSETEGEDCAQVELERQTGLIHDDLTLGVNVSAALPLRSNHRISGTGLIIGNRGFVLTNLERDAFITAHPEATHLIHPLRNGRDISDTPREVYVIDTHSTTLEYLMEHQPSIYQRLLVTVQPYFGTTNAGPGVPKR